MVVAEAARAVTRGRPLRDRHPPSFRPILTRAKLATIRFGDLRHACATLHLMEDVSVKVVSERPGRAAIRLTLDNDSHVRPTMQERASERLDALFGRLLAG